MICREPLWIRQCPCLNPLFSVNPLPLSPLLLCLSARWPWEEGEQMLDEGGRGDVGVHADHHVLSLNSLLLSLNHHNSMAAVPTHCSPAPPTKRSGPPRPPLPHSLTLLWFPPPSPSQSLLVQQSSLQGPPVITHVNFIINLSVLKQRIKG